MKKSLACGFLLLCTMTYSVSMATDYPTKPIETLVGYPAGGSTDTIFRIVSSPASKLLGKPVVVVNKTGASGALAMIAGAKAEPDGHTLVMLTIAQSIQTALKPNAGFNALKDYAPIALLVTQANVLMVPASSRYKSVSQLVEAAKKNPGKMTICGSGIGSSPHISGEMFKSMAGIDLTYIPHKGGAPCLMAVVGEHLDCGFINAPPVIPQIKAGKVRALAVTTSKRIPELPETPTLAESGLPGYEVVSWLGVAAPAGTPAPIVEKLGDVFKQILQDAESIEKMKAAGFIPSYKSPREFESWIKSEFEKYKKLGKEQNIKLQ